MSENNKMAVVMTVLFFIVIGLLQLALILIPKVTMAIIATICVSGIVIVVFVGFHKLIEMGEKE